MIIRRNALILTLTAACALLLCGNAAAQNKKTPEAFTVVLDPGHGGKDPGANYSGVKEKDINLAVALKFGKLISDNCPDVKVVYTRRTDVFIELDERGNIANKAGANLFISLHCDAIDGKPSVSGASTYIMGMDKTENNLREAMRENSVMKYEDDYSQKYEGFDPTSPESYIIFSLMQYAYFDRSLQFANIIQKQYAKETSFSNRGAKQGPFYVLWKPAMPSVLTEMGFLSNDGNRKYITSEKGQNDAAKALFAAFQEYREATEKKGGETDQQAAPAVAENRSENKPVVISGNKPVELVPAEQVTVIQNKPAEQKPAETATVQNKPADKPTEQKPAVTVSEIKPAEQKPAEQKPVQTTTVQTKPAEPKPVEKPAPPKMTDGVGFYVQLCASRVEFGPDDTRFDDVMEHLVEKKIDGWYKYYIGGYIELDDAVRMRDQMKRGRFKDAFIISLDGSQQTTIDQTKPVEQKPVQVPVPVKPAPPKMTDGVGFYVQLCATRVEFSENDTRFDGCLEYLVEKKIDGWYKYYIGGYTVLNDAIRMRDQMKRGNFKDAFIIALDGDKQITIDEARRRIAAENNR